MKHTPHLFVSMICLGLTGCLNDQTSAMAQSCQRMLESDPDSIPRTFIEDADARIASLKKPHGKLVNFAIELQDPDASRYRPTLEYCIAQVKSVRASGS